MSSSRPTQFPRQTGGVKLDQVYPPPESDTITDIDIIAIHGLDTDSTVTWTWKHRDPEKQAVNWLKDPDMLPRRIPTARIFTCDWPASLFKDKLNIQMTAKELARSLLLAIQSRPDANPTRPILFIASCLGGIILIQAMVLSAEPGSEYNSLWEATRGIVFLATPFRGTAFQGIASKAVDFLKTYASLTDRVVTNLLGSLKESTPFLQDLVSGFTSICVQRKQRDQSCRLAGFYETEMSNLLRKFLPPPLADTLKEPKVLVDSGSARLDIVPNPIPLERTHVLMNKFYGPEDPGYGSVSGQMEIIVCEIRQARPIDKANAWLRNDKYSLKNLGIERLSGDLLPMDRCYINMAIVEEASNKFERSASPFSLFARLKVEISQGWAIELPDLFEASEGENGQTRPSRILIRGRAGVGKTTLCKKIIYEFTHCRLWQGLFDCVFWVPLRNLKLEDRRQNSSGYNMKWLFYYEYFTQHPEGEELAGNLWRALTDTKASKMLFVLDGLDEVSQDLDGGMLNFIRTLLNQPNVIITSRPNSSLPANLEPIHLELETIGFYPDQVDTYIKNAFTVLETGELDYGKIKEIQSFLKSHRLIQGLVRIPIQLDALCYTWDNSRDTYSTRKNAQETMTAIYRRIEESLWRKDVRRLEILNQYGAQLAQQQEITRFTNPELNRLAFLAFTGMNNDIINFEPTHRDAVSKHFEPPDQKFLLDYMLERVSFLRSSDSSSKRRDRIYHFLHLTFQEYFAARYFAQQWTDRRDLKCLLFSDREVEYMDPTEFLRRNKYKARYNIFWRFVAGLISPGEDTTRFFQTIEEEPRDLLGPAHQRLIMNCLAEVSKEMSLRKPLEDQLSQWLLFECKSTGAADLAREIEFPVEILNRTLEQEPIMAVEVLLLLTRRRGLYGELGELAQSITACLKDENWVVRYTAIEALQGQPMTEEHLQAIAACLKDEDRMVRYTAIEALQGQPMTEERLQAIAACLKDENRMVRSTAIAALQGQPMTEERLQAIVACLKDEDRDVRCIAIEALQGQPITEEHLQAIIACLKDDDGILRHRAAEFLKFQLGLPEWPLTLLIGFLEHKSKTIKDIVVRILKDRPITEDHLQAIGGRLENKDWGVRTAAIETLKGRLALPETLLQAIAARLKDDNWVVREAAIEALRSQSTLSGELLQATTAAEIAKDRPAQLERGVRANIAYLEHVDVDVRIEALERFQDQPALPKDALQAVLACFEDENLTIRRVAIKVLQEQPALSEGILQAVAACLKNENRGIRQAAIEVLQKQPALSENILQAVAAFFEDENWEVKKAAIEALQAQPALSEGFLQAVAACFEDENWKVRRAAIMALQKQPALSEGILQAVAACLKDENWGFRQAAIEALQKQPALSEGILQAVAACLKDENWDIRQAAIKVLQKQPALPEGLVRVVVARLKDDDEEVRRAAVETLITHRVLSLIPNRHIKSFYKSLLERGFEEHTTLQVVGKTSYITLGNEDYSMDLPYRFMFAIWMAQKTLGVPPHLGTRLQSTPKRGIHFFKRKISIKKAFRARYQRVARARSSSSIDS